MLGILVIAMCVAAALAIGRILLALYAPRPGRSVRVPRSGRAVIVQPALAVGRRPPAPPRQRIARGTGSVVQDARERAMRADQTDKIARP